MPRVKKSRKIGQIGTPKSTENTGKKPPSTNQAGKPKKKTGKPSGSRHNVDTPKKKPIVARTAVDPRLGSKKPVSLIAKAPEKSKPKYFSPAQELEAIENDLRLGKLLDKQDQNKKLSYEEQQYLDKTLARHRQLCELLGIEDDDDPESEEMDIMDKLDASHLERFKP